MNPIVTSLPAYVEEQRLPLLAKSTLGSKSAKLFNVMTDVKGDTALNLVDTEVVFGSGADCGWNESGSTTLSQRVMNAKPLKVNMAYCDKKLLGTWAQHEVKIAAGIKTLPFEEEFTNGIVEGVQEKLEKMIYQGDGDNENEFDGLIKILTEASATTVNSGSTAYEKIKNVYMKMPAAVVGKSDAVILVSDAMYREYMQDLVSANLYHYDPANGEDEYKLPGTNVRVISVNGLDGVEGFEYVIGARLSNLFYGTDGLGDEAKYELWYSQDNREFRLAIEFEGGSQVAFPEEVVMGKFSK